MKQNKYIKSPLLYKMGAGGIFQKKHNEPCKHVHVKNALTKKGCWFTSSNFSVKSIYRGVEQPGSSLGS